MDAFLAVKGGQAVFARRDGLAGTDFDAQFGAALLALIGKNKRDMIGVTLRGLHFPAHEQGVLMRDEQLAVVRNGRPAGAFHEGGMRGNAAGVTVIANFPRLSGRDAASKIIFERGNAFPGPQRAAGQGKPSAAQTGQRHAEQAGDNAALKTVARFFGGAGFLLQPTGAAALHVGRNFLERMAASAR